MLTPEEEEEEEEEDEEDEEDELGRSCGGRCAALWKLLNPDVGDANPAALDKSIKP